MAYRYKPVLRKKPGTQEGKYYASISSISKITEKDLAVEIGELTALNRTDVRSVLDSLMQVIPRQLSRGMRVQLGELGSFDIKAKSEGKETAEEVNAHCIERPRPQFTCGRSLQNAVEHISFEKVE